jgi:hypothetical protein
MFIELLINRAYKDLNVTPLSDSLWERIKENSFYIFVTHFVRDRIYTTARYWTVVVQQISFRCQVFFTAMVIPSYKENINLLVK